MPNGEPQKPGGWNRVVLRVHDLPAFIETLKKAGEFYVHDKAIGQSVRAALAFLEGKHVYVSKFKPGDEVWCIATTGANQHRRWYPWDKINTVVCVCCATSSVYVDGDHYNPTYRMRYSDCFPTREAAEQEVERRNKENNP